MIKDLKSRAYDLLALIERAKAELQQVNEKILEESKKESQNDKKEKKDK